MEQVACRIRCISFNKKRILQQSNSEWFFI